METFKRIVGGFSGNKLRLLAAGVAVCLSVGVAAPVFAQEEDPNAPENTVVCETKSAIAWLICPVVNAVNEGVAALYGFIIDRLQFGLLEPVDDEQNGLSGLSQTNYDNLRKSWGTVAKLGTGLLVGVFLLILMGQSMSGFNFIDAYTAKRMLPRLVIALLLVNISWYLVAFAIEVGNIVGGGIRDVILAPFRTGDLGTASIVADPGNAGSAILLGLLTVGILVFVLGPGIMAVAPIIVAIGLAVLIGMVFVVLRQGLLMVLIVSSPIAIVLSTLPGTQKYFNFWQNALTGAILIYPMFSAVVAIGAVLAIITGANANADPNNPEALGFFRFVIAVFCYFVPFFLLPYLVKFSSGIVGKFAGMANDRSKGVIDRTRNWQQERRALAPSKILRQQAKQEKARSAQLNALQLGSGSGWSSRLRRFRASPGVPRMRVPFTDKSIGGGKSERRRDAMMSSAMAAQEGEIGKQLQGMDLGAANEFLKHGGDINVASAAAGQAAVQQANSVRQKTGQPALSTQQAQQVSAQAASQAKAKMGGSFKQMESMGYKNNPAFASAVGAATSQAGMLDMGAMRAGGKIAGGAPGSTAQAQWQAKMDQFKSTARGAGQLVDPADAPKVRNMADLKPDSIPTYMSALTQGQPVAPTGQSTMSVLDPGSGQMRQVPVTTFGAQGDQVAASVARAYDQGLSGAQIQMVNAHLDQAVGPRGNTVRDEFDKAVTLRRTGAK